MAAEILATLGCRVTVYEQMASVGRKLLLAGRSGLNLTHSEPTDELLSRYSCSSDLVRSAIRSFDSESVRRWAGGLGEDTFVGSSGRVFPHSWRAAPLLRAWLRRLADLGVAIETRHRWAGWDTEPTPHRPHRLRLERSGGTRHADAAAIVTAEFDVVVLALGGASWPRTGSDGRWTALLADRHLAIEDFEPSNAAALVRWSEHFRNRFEGVPLKNVSLTCGSRSVRGDVMVTRSGLEGTPVYAHSACLRTMLRHTGDAVLHVDLRPDTSLDTLAQRLSARRARETTSNWLRRCGGLRPESAGLLREATANTLPTTAEAMASLVKHLPVHVHALAGLERAISSAGGLSMDEVDEHWMLRRIPGMFVAGEMLDWDAPTGGYLLQAALATSVAAATEAYRWAEREQGAER